MDRVLQRRDTAANWSSVNPILAEGEIGIITDGAKGYKIGDGLTRWNALEFPANPTSVVGELGDSEVAVINLKAVTKIIDCYNVSKYHINNIAGDPSFGTNKFTLEQAIDVVPDTFRYNGISIRFISSTSNITETWLYSGILDWLEITYNWINLNAEILCGDDLLSIGLVNAKVETSLPFIYKSCFSIDTESLLVVNWLLGYYNSQGVLSHISVETYRASTINISPYKGGMLFLTIKSEAGAYCGFKDSSGVLISAFLSIRGSATVNIPDNASILFISNRFKDLPDQYVSIQATNKKIYVAAKETDMKLIKLNISTKNLPLKWILGEYWTSAGDINTVETYSRTDKFDITPYVGETLVFHGRSILNAYIVAFSSSGSVVSTFQTVNDLVSIDITSAMSTIGFSNRTDSIHDPYCTNGEIIKAASAHVVENITSVLPITNNPKFLWKQGGINSKGEELDSQDLNYNYRIRTINYYEVAAQTIELNIKNGFGYRVFEYLPNNTFLKYSNFDNGGINSYTLLDINNKLKFNILYSSVETPIDPSVAEDTEFIIQGLKDWDEHFEEIASKQYVKDSIKENITKNNLKNKKVSFIGDSITAGVSCPNNPYHKVFCNLYGAIDNPLGVSGTCIANNTKNNLSDQRFVTRATQSNLQDSSLIIIFGGTNDFSYDSKPIGASFIETAIEPSGNIGSKKLSIPTDTDTFSGALHELINTVRMNCPAIPIVFITPLQRGRYNVNNPNSDESNANGNYLSDFSKSIREICSFYSIPVLDLGSISELDFMNAQISSKYSSDNLHPDCLGHSIIGELLFRFVENNVIIK